MCIFLLRIMSSIQLEVIETFWSQKIIKEKLTKLTKIKYTKSLCIILWADIFR